MIDLFFILAATAEVNDYRCKRLCNEYLQKITRQCTGYIAAQSKSINAAREDDDAAARIKQLFNIPKSNT